jgi:hypothetical protein
LRSRRTRGVAPPPPARAGGGPAPHHRAYREAALKATPPNIIECAEASEGASQEACHLPNDKRFKSLGQKGVTLWMTGYSGSGKSTIARALEEKLVLEYGLHVSHQTKTRRALCASLVKTWAEKHKEDN